jgi:ABC-type uncharacterized transport system involved in gliding motility auxiliary subunit
MDSKWRRLAPFGLYLALLAGLAAIGLYIVQREWNLALQICLALVVLGLAAFAILDPGKLRQGIKGRQARYGSNAIVVLIAVLGILGVVTYIAYKNDKRLDLTEDKTNTLASETLDTLAKLTEPATAVAYFTSRSDTTATRLLLEEFMRNSDGNFQYKFVDPEADPVAAQNAGITQDGTIVIVMGDRSQQVTYADEQRVTSALVKLLSGDMKTVYFLTGHGEKNPEGTDEQAYSMAKTKLTSKNYTVKKLNLLTTNSIPADAAVLVIAGPVDPLREGEVQLISEYLANGGAAIVMEDPTLMTKMGDQPDLLANYLSETWGVNFGNDIIIDQIGQQLFQQALAAVGGAFAAHAIVPDELATQVFVFQGARSVSGSENAADTATVEVIKTGDKAWAETDLTALTGGQINPDQGVDIVGSVPLVTTSAASTSNARLVVVGDSDFASNTYQSAYGNSDLFVNMVDWAAGQDNLISLTPKSTTTRTLNLPQIPYFTGLLYLVTLVILPGIALVMGIVVFIRRRRAG